MDIAKDEHEQQNSGRRARGLMHHDKAAHEEHGTDNEFEESCSRRRHVLNLDITPVTMFHLIQQVRAR